MSKVPPHTALALAAIVFGTPHASIEAAETTTLQYDALGRLVQSTTAGGPVSGQQTTTAYERAGNRSNQTVVGAPTLIILYPAAAGAIPALGKRYCPAP